MIPEEKSLIAEVNVWVSILCPAHVTSLCRVCPPEASEIMHDIGTAIEYLHHMDIAHRDVKVLLLLTEHNNFFLNTLNL